MNLRNLEKMFEVMDSLEPAISKPIKIDVEEMKVERGISSNYQNYGLPMKPRKPSLPLAVSAPSVRRGSVDTRKSLFHNERFHPISNRLPFFNANSRNTVKLEENEFNEINGEDFLYNHSVPKYCNDSNVYETVAIQIDINDTEEHTNQERKTDNRDTLTTLPIDFPSDFSYRDNSDTMKRNKLRYSNLSDNANRNRSLEDQLINTGLQSAPESARNSARVESLYSKDNQSSIDSGVNQQISVNLSSYLSNETNLSNDSFSDISESNITACSDTEVFTLNDEAKDYRQRNLTYSDPFKPYNEKTLKSSDFHHEKYSHSIKTEEEQIQFYRQVSKEMSLRNFSPHEIIIFFMKDGSSSQVIDKFQTASSVCSLLKKKYNKPEKTMWQLVEVIGKELLERPIEDHENILDIFYSWENDHLYNKFLFQENPLPHNIFEEPSAYLNEMKNDFEIADVLWAKEANGKWIYTMCYIADGSIYYTSKRGSKAPKDLYCLVNLKEVDFYSCSNSKKTKKEIKAQTSHIIAFKFNKVDHRPQENAYLVASTDRQKEKWLIALKVAKYSFNQLKNNYLESQMCFPTGFRSQANSDATLDGTYNPVDSMDI